VRALVLVAILGLGCGHAEPVSSQDAGPALDDVFDATVARIATRRAALASMYAAARTDDARRAVRADARRFLLAAIRDELFPLWLGTPWGLGSNSTATRPHQPGMTVGCSYFVTAILGNVGFHLDNRYTFARAPALDIQRSLAPDRAAVHRFLSIPAVDLERRVAALGDGLWLIGLSNHIAWVDVDHGAVRMVHAYGEVKDEPLVTAHAIDVSRKAGYFVSPVLVDSGGNDALVDAWLRGATVRFRAAS
jgi:hypothetical protein